MKQNKISDFEREMKIAMLLQAEAKANTSACQWLSFCDPEKPSGEQFKGVIISRTLGMMHALERANALGINPGGEVVCLEIEGNDIHPDHFDVLLTKKQLIEHGYCEG